jgi:hypothetical protein
MRIGIIFIKVIYKCLFYSYMMWLTHLYGGWFVPVTICRLFVLSRRKDDKTTIIVFSPRKDDKTKSRQDYKITAKRRQTQPAN